MAACKERGGRESSQYSGMFLYATPLTPTGDVFEAGELITRYLFQEYHEAVSVKKSSWEKVKHDLQFLINTPQGQPPFPAVLLIHGSSPAFSRSMVKRTDALLSKGYAVMTLDSFTRYRCLADCFDKATPCSAYEAPNNTLDGILPPLKNQCPIVDEASSAYPAIMKAYMDRVTKGYALLPAERTQDFFAALDILRADPRIDSSRLSVIGYSHGGSVVLEALTLAKAGKPPPGLDTLPENALDGVNAAIAYYPNCQPGTYYRWHESIVSIPTLLILAKQDEFVTPYFCRDTARKINRRLGWRIIEALSFQNKHAFDMVEYPEAYDPVSEGRARDHVMTFLKENSDPEQ